MSSQQHDEPVVRMTDTNDRAEQPVDEPEETTADADDADGAEGAEDSDRSDRVATGEASVDELRAEVEQLRAQYQRAMADYQNLERRSREQRIELGQITLADAVSGFLPVLDDLQRAVEAAQADAGEAAWVEGVRLVAQKFEHVLDQHGVKEIHALGQPFDPMKHEAVGSAPGPEGQVVHLLQRGYQLRDRIVRPAMVMVGNGEDAPPAPSEA